MMQCFETVLKKTWRHTLPGTITLYNVDGDGQDLLPLWRSAHPSHSTGAMGTRAKQRAENDQISLDFTYGVIDKCILKALLGEDSLILTTDSMVSRVYQRVDAYCRESGICIDVQQLDGSTRAAVKNGGSAR
jgi:cobalt/nickel transport system ATP-binding protein